MAAPLPDTLLLLEALFFSFSAFSLAAFSAFFTDGGL
jgi:hypothetical protein